MYEPQLCPATALPPKKAWTTEKNPQSRYCSRHDHAAPNLVSLPRKALNAQRHTLLHSPKTVLEWMHWRPETNPGCQGCLELPHVNSYVIPPTLRKQESWVQNVCCLSIRSDCLSLGKRSWADRPKPSIHSSLVAQFWVTCLFAKRVSTNVLGFVAVAVHQRFQLLRHLPYMVLQPLAMATKLGDIITKGGRLQLPFRVYVY